MHSWAFSWGVVVVGKGEKTRERETARLRLAWSSGDRDWKNKTKRRTHSNLNQLSAAFERFSTRDVVKPSKRKKATFPVTGPSPRARLQIPGTWHQVKIVELPGQRIPAST